MDLAAITDHTSIVNAFVDLMSTIEPNSAWLRLRPETLETIERIAAKAVEREKCKTNNSLIMKRAILLGEQAYEIRRSQRMNLTQFPELLHEIDLNEIDNNNNNNNNNSITTTTTTTAAANEDDDDDEIGEAQNTEDCQMIAKQDWLSHRNKTKFKHPFRSHSWIQNQKSQINNNNNNNNNNYNYYLRHHSMPRTDRVLLDYSADEDDLIRDYHYRYQD